MGKVVRVITGLAFVVVAACAPGEPETHMTSADVDDAAVPAMLAAIDGLTDNELPVDELLAMTASVPMDQEKQQRVAVTFRGEQSDMLIHIWREQVDWVHVYASSTSGGLIEAVEDGIRPFERSAD